MNVLCIKCPVKLQLIIDRQLDTGTIQISDDEHVHPEETRKIYGICPAAKELILGYEKMHLKPKVMLERHIIDVQGIQKPTTQ
jgi:hypothetical protein